MDVGGFYNFGYFTAHPRIIAVKVCVWDVTATLHTVLPLYSQVIALDPVDRHLINT